MSLFIILFIIVIIYLFQMKAVTLDDAGLKTLDTTTGPYSGFDCLIWAIGRVPSTDGLGLEKVVGIWNFHYHHFFCRVMAKLRQASCRWWRKPEYPGKTTA